MVVVVPEAAVVSSGAGDMSFSLSTLPEAEVASSHIKIKIFP
jgi:hypothetical protein